MKQSWMVKAIYLPPFHKGWITRAGPTFALRLIEHLIEEVATIGHI